MKNRKKDFILFLHQLREKEKKLKERRKISDVEWLLENRKIAEKILGYRIKIKQKG